MERRGLLEMLISCGEEVNVCVHVCLFVFVYLVSSSVFLCLETAPVSPFIVEGGIGVIHVFAMRRLVSGGGVSEPCGLLLWRHGQQSSLVLDALEQRAGHT